MAYVTGAQIRALLPIDDPAISEADCQALVDEWIGAVNEAYGSTPEVPLTAPETWRTRRIVREGALADAELRLFEQSGFYGDAEAIRERLARAENSLKSYDRDHTSTSETSREAPVAYIREW